MSLQSRFAPKDVLTDEERERGLRDVVRDGMASQAMASLTGSAFLTAFALSLGASNVLIGVLAAIPQLAQLVQVPAVRIVEAVRNRRLVSVTASLAGRSAWLLLALAPLLLSDEGALAVMVLGLLAASLAAAVSNCAWNAWMHDLISPERLGEFSARRLGRATATGIIVSLAAAFFIDYAAGGLFPDVRYGYAVLFAAGFGMGVVGVVFVARVPEPRMTVTDEPLLQSLARPFRDANFRNLMRFVGTWNAAMYLATPFFTVYMLDRLGLDLSVVIGLIVLGRLVNVLFLRLWGQFADRISNTSVLRVSGPLCLLCILGWTFTTLPGRHALTVPLLVVLHALMGVAMSGITLATGNIGMKLAPAGRAVSYLAGYNVVHALAAGAAPVLGGVLADFFVERQLSWAVTWSGPGVLRTWEALNFQQWDFLFVLAFVLGLYALHRLSMVREAGEVEERVVAYELAAALGREVRNFSSVGSLWYVVSIRAPRRRAGALPRRRAKTRRRA